MVLPKSKFRGVADFFPVVVIVVGECQIYSILGHIAQKCYYHYYQPSDEPPMMTPMRFPSNHVSTANMA